MTAIGQRDLFLIEAVVFVMTVTIILVNFLIDTTYSYLDPKIRL